MYIRILTSSLVHIMWISRFQQKNNNKTNSTHATDINYYASIRENIIVVFWRVYILIATATSVSNGRRIHTRTTAFPPSPPTHRSLRHHISTTAAAATYALPPRNFEARLTPRVTYILGVCLPLARRGGTTKSAVMVVSTRRYNIIVHVWRRRRRYQ